MSDDATSRSVAGRASEDLDEDRSVPTRAADIRPSKAPLGRPANAVAMQDAASEAARRSPTAAGTAPTLLSRLGEAVVSELVHCACTQAGC